MGGKESNRVPVGQIPPEEPGVVKLFFCNASCKRRLRHAMLFEIPHTFPKLTEADPRVVLAVFQNSGIRLVTQDEAIDRPVFLLQKFCEQNWILPITCYDPHTFHDSKTLLART
jgi:hypothetical protein